MRLLLCPPVAPFDPPARIREWLGELARIRERYAGDDESLLMITLAEEQARAWLENAIRGETS